jgi:hypothetical protein
VGAGAEVENNLIVPSETKAAGALNPESTMKTLVSAFRVEIESRKHAIRPTRLPADELRIFPLVTGQFFLDSGNVTTR